MAQHDYDITTADANTGITYRAAVNAALQALASLSSGASEPSVKYPCQLWADTTNGLLKIRNTANTSWITVGRLEDTNLGLLDVNTYNFGANTILKADSAGSPTALAIPEQSVVGRKTGGSIAALTGAEAATIVSPQLFPIKNLGLAASVSSDALTVSLKDANGNDPSSTSPVIIGFRNATLTTGTPVIRTRTSATSITLPEGGTLGFNNSEMGRIYIWAIDNAGTIELALSRTADIFPEDKLVSTVAIGDSPNSPTTMYSTTARTNVACRCIGYIEIQTGETAGYWSNAPTKIQMMVPGVEKTGRIVQSVCVIETEFAKYTGFTPFAFNDTIPKSSQGVQLLAASISPIHATSKIVVSCCINLCSPEDERYVFAALFKDSDSNAIASAASPPFTCDCPISLSLRYEMPTNAASSITFKVRGSSNFTDAVGRSAVGINGSYKSNKRLFGGTLYSWLRIEEVCA